MAETSSSVRVVGLDEFRRELRGLGPEWPKALRAAHKEIADRGAGYSRGVATSMGGVQARAAGAIKGYATDKAAKIGIRAGARTKMAFVAFWGADQHTGWYANRRYAGSARQHPAWVGNSWDAAVAGQGPYAINEALARHLSSLLDEYFEAITKLARQAFPD